MKSGKITKTNFSNGFLNIIDKKYTGFNPIKKLISWIKFRRTCRKTFNTSPSFGQLWSFSDSDIDHVVITLKLYSDTQGIIMDVKRTNGTNMVTSLKFKENDWEEPPKESDIILLDNVIGIINRHIVMLMQYCYDRRGSYDYENTIPEVNKKF